MEGKGGLRAPFGLCRPRCSPLSAEATFPASPRSDLGEWGEPRRRHGPHRVEASNRGRGKPGWAPSPRGDRDRHGGRGTVRLPGTPTRRWRLPLERGCGEEKRKAVPGKPRGRLRSWLSFRLWLASGSLGAAEPRCARGLARAGSAGCQRRPPRAAIVWFAKPRLHAGDPPAGRSQAVAKPRRGRLAGPGDSRRAPGGSGKRPFPAGTPLSAGCEGNRIPLPCAAREPVPGSRRLPGASKEEDTS